MKFARNSSGDDFEISVIPLIDVMLTLLMFFVMTATFEHHSLMRVSLPESSADPVSSEQELLTIVIDAEGRTYIGANEVLNPNVDTIKTALEEAAGEDRNRQVSLRADGKTPHQSVVTAMDALGQLGFAKLSIATVQAKSSGGK